MTVLLFGQNNSSTNSKKPYKSFLMISPKNASFEEIKSKILLNTEIQSINRDVTREKSEDLELLGAAIGTDKINCSTVELYS